jgi:hypothetical protein
VKLSSKFKSIFEKDVTVVHGFRANALSAHLYFLMSIYLFDTCLTASQPLNRPFISPSKYIQDKT